MSFGSRSLPPATPEQIRRWELIREKGCVCCRMHGYMGGVEIHHLKSGNLRMGHWYTVGLCGFHHRGIGDGIGVSLAEGSRTFAREYGGDEYLLRYQNELIGWTAPPVRERRRKSKCTASDKQVKRPQGGFSA